MVNERGVRQRIHCDKCTRQLSNIRNREQFKSINNVEVEAKPIEDPYKELNDKIAEWAKHCKKCLWWYYGGIYQFCDFRTWHDYGPCRGEKPGDCKDFLDLETHKGELQSRKQPISVIGRTRNNGGRK